MPFHSFVDLRANLLVPPAGNVGILLILKLNGTTLNLISLVGLVQFAANAMPTSSLIVEFVQIPVEEAKPI
jgi:multidrug efflux pump subunit AcrB